MSPSYSSNISRSQFELIRPILESARRSTRPRTLDLYDVFCAILYVLKSGCQWRMLTHDFPNWTSCYYYFSIWSEKQSTSTSSVLEDVLKNIGIKDAYQGR